MTLQQAKKCPRCLVFKEACEYWVITRRSGRSVGRQELSSYCKLCASDYMRDWHSLGTPAVIAYHRDKRSCGARRYAEKRDSILPKMNARYRAMTSEEKRHRNEVRQEWRRRTGKP